MGHPAARSVFPAGAAEGPQHGAQHRLHRVPGMPCDVSQARAGGDGPGRVYDSRYNPIPSNPSSAVIYNQRYNIQSIDAIRPVILNSNVNAYFISLLTFQINNYETLNDFLYFRHP